MFSFASFVYFRDYSIHLVNYVIKADCTFRFPCPDLDLAVFEGCFSFHITSLSFYVVLPVMNTEVTVIQDHFTL